MNNTEIGQRIKQHRVEIGMSLQDIADLTGVARSTIQRYETGKIDKLKLPVIESIARALGVRPDWIIGKTNEKYPKSNVSPKIFSYYNKLNEHGKEAATEQVRLLTLDEKYTRSDEELDLVSSPEAKAKHYAPVNVPEGSMPDLLKLIKECDFMTATKERIIGAVALMNEKEAESFWKLIQNRYVISQKTWNDIEEVEPDEIDLAMLKEIESDPDCQEFLSSDEVMKELNL